MIPRNHLSAGNNSPTIMCFPFWLAFGASGFVHAAAIAAFSIIVETDQIVEPLQLTVELVRESSLKTAPFASPAIPFAPIEEHSLQIHEPIALAERQFTPHLKPRQSNGLALAAPTTKPPSKPATTQLTTIAMPAPQLAAQKLATHSMEGSLKVQRLKINSNLLLAKSSRLPTPSALISLVPSRFSRAHQEPTPSSPELILQPKPPLLNNVRSTTMEPLLSAPKQFNEPTLQTVATQSTVPHTKMIPSQERTASAQLPSMPALSVISNPESATSNVPLMPTRLSSRQTRSSELQSLDGSTKHIGSLKRMPVTNQQESTANYQDPELGNKPPEYPRRARRQGLEGRVVIAIAVSTQGRPREVLVTASSGFKILDHAALEAVQRWRFLPAHRGDVPVDSKLMVPIVFRLCADEKSCSEH